MKHREILKAYVTAIETGQWDYPKSSAFDNGQQVYDLVKQGKTIYEFAETASIKFGTVTGTILGFSLQKEGIGGYLSKSTKSAISKGIKYALNQ
jgi:hypothetical protein